MKAESRITVESSITKRWRSFI